MLRLLAILTGVGLSLGCASAQLLDTQTLQKTTRATLAAVSVSAMRDGRAAYVEATQQRYEWDTADNSANITAQGAQTGENYIAPDSDVDGSSGAWVQIRDTATRTTASATGGIAATDVQAALAELDTEKLTGVFADQAESEAGSSSTVVMSPLRAEQHADAWLNRGVSGVLSAATLDGSATGYNIASEFGGVWRTGDRFELIRTDAAATGAYYALSILSDDAGLASGGVTNNTGALFVEAKRTDYLTTQEDGQVIASQFINEAPRNSIDGSEPILFGSYKVHANTPGSPGNNGDALGIEGRLVIHDEDGITGSDVKSTLSLGLGWWTQEGTTFTWFNKSIGHWAEVQDNTTFGAFAGLLANDRLSATSTGFEYYLSGQATRAVQTFGITGSAHSSAIPGRVLAGNGTAALPSLSFLSDPDSGLDTGGANIVTMSTAGVARTTWDASGNVVHTGNVTAANLSSGTYTPTLSNPANLSSQTAQLHYYGRNGIFVTVGGQLTLDPVATGTTSLELTLPPAATANFSDTVQCAGAAGLNGSGQGAGKFTSIAANDTCQLIFFAASTSPQTWSYNFSYRIP